MELHPSWLLNASRASLLSPGWPARGWLVVVIVAAKAVGLAAVAYRCDTRRD